MLIYRKHMLSLTWPVYDTEGLPVFLLSSLYVLLNHLFAFSRLHQPEKFCTAKKSQEMYSVIQIAVRMLVTTIFSVFLSHSHFLLEISPGKHLLIYFPTAEDKDLSRCQALLFGRCLCIQNMVYKSSSSALSTWTASTLGLLGETACFACYFSFHGLWIHTQYICIYACNIVYMHSI